MRIDVFLQLPAKRGGLPQWKRTKVLPKEIKVDPLAHELATSEGTQPYLDCLIKAYRDNAVGLEAALEVNCELSVAQKFLIEILWSAEIPSAGSCRTLKIVSAGALVPTTA